jgi:hypothetical protein
MLCTKEATFVIVKEPGQKSGDYSYVCDEHLAEVAMECLKGYLGKSIRLQVIPTGPQFRGPKCERGVE